MGPEVILTVLHPVPSMKIRILEGVQGAHGMTGIAFAAFR